MEKNEKKAAEAQGAKGAEKKQQKVSASYTVRAFGENIKKLQSLGLLKGEELIKISEIHGTIIQNYIKKELGIESIG